MKYYDQIDSLRAIAVIAVIIGHIDHRILPSGYLGVDVFFVISGFVVMHSLLNKTATTPIEFLKNFYRKRFKRLYPALLLCFFTFIPLMFAVMPNPETSLKTGIASIFAHSNLYLIKKKLDYFGGDASINLFTHTWTLSLEEQFYFIFPLIFIIAGLLQKNSSDNKRKFLLISSGLIVSSLAFYFYYFTSRYDWSFYLMPSRLWQLLLGAVISIVGTKLVGLKTQKGILLNFLIGGVILVFFSPHEYQVINTLIMTVLTTLILIQISLESSSKLLHNDTMKLTGKMSYSLYLWHWPLIVLLKLTFGYSVLSLVLLVLVMFGSAHLSYRFIELYFRNKPRWSMATGIIFFILPFSTLLIKGASEDISQKLFMGNPLEAYAAEGESYWNQKTCSVNSRKNLEFNYDEFKRRVLSDCKFNISNESNGNPKKRILLFGNSYAEQLLPTMRTFASTNPQFEVYAFTAPTCPLWLDHFEGVPDVSREKCSTLYAMSRKLVLEEFKKDDVLILATPFYHFLLNNAFILNNELISGAQAFEIFHQDMNDFSSHLENRGIKVLLTNSVPLLNVEAALCYQPWSPYNSMCDFENIIDQSKTDEMKKFNARFAKDQIIDLFTSINEAVRADKSNIRAFKEKDHLSVFSTKIVLKELASKLD